MCVQLYGLSKEVVSAARSIICYPLIHQREQRLMLSPAASSGCSSVRLLTAIPYLCPGGFPDNPVLANKPPPFPCKSCNTWNLSPGWSWRHLLRNFSLRCTLRALTCFSCFGHPRRMKQLACTPPADAHVR